MLTLVLSFNMPRGGSCKTNGVTVSIGMTYGVSKGKETVGPASEVPRSQECKEKPVKLQ